MSAESRPVGRIVEIKGVVLDAVFDDHLPAIYSALEIPMTGEGGEGHTLVAEVQQHLGDNRVRAVAMDATDGLARGADVFDTGASISVPVGEKTLGRIFNVLGQTIDKKGDEDFEDAPRWESTASRRRSTSCRPPPRSSRPESRSSICSRRT